MSILISQINPRWDIPSTVILTLIWAGSLQALFPINPLPPGDPQTFHGIATQLIEKHIIQETWSTYRSWRAPGYPTFVASIYALVGESPQMVIWIQYFLWGILNACLYGLSLIVWQQRTIALCAVILSLLYLPVFYYASIFYAEMLFLSLVGLALWATVVHMQKKAAPTYMGIGVGILWGLAILTRTALVYFPIFFLSSLFLFALITRTVTQTQWRKTIFIFFGIICTITPWTIRNYVVHDRFLLTGSYGGYNLFMTQYPLKSYEKWPGRIPAHIWPEIDQAINQVIQTHTEVQQDRKLSQMAVDIIRQYPARFLYKCASEFIKFYTYAGAYGQGYLRYVSVFQYMGLIGAAIIGCFTLKNRKLAYFLGLYILYFGLIHAVTFSMGRLKEAIMPAVLLLAIQGLQTLWHYRPSPKTINTPPPPSTPV